MWKEYKQSFDKKEKEPTADDDKADGDEDDAPLSTTRVGGYVYDNGKSLGRIVNCPVAGDPRGQLVTVTCYLKAHGPHCSQQVRLEGGMTRASLVQWIRHSARFACAVDHGKALVAGEGFCIPAVPPPAVPPPPGRQPAGSWQVGAVARPGSRQVTHDGLIFTELWSAGRMTGVSRLCRHHGCIRDLTFGKKHPMSYEEARRRLLAWEAAGAGDVQAAMHVALGRDPLLNRYALA